MFTKLKNKIAEEVKQSPLKLSASVQQLAQAVVSPSSSSVVEPASNDHFSIGDDSEETPQNSPSKSGGFQSVDLHGEPPLSPPVPSAGGRSRHSSTSSVTSDASSLFPIFESSVLNSFSLQSDLESASEVEDSLSHQLDRISKEQLYAVYRKVQARYTKYKGRYADLARHYRELDRENVKAKTVLAESQDKALRRIAELKEQCQLEQKAKAHLEDALRNDLEEKDHLISTLYTQIDLLKLNGGKEEDEPRSQKVNSSENLLIDLSGGEPTVPIQMKQPQEVFVSSDTDSVLKEKIWKLESLLSKCKESIKRNKERISELSLENQQLQQTVVDTKASSSEQLSTLTEDLTTARQEIVKLVEALDTLRKREEDSALSLAENKMTIHRELEAKEEQIKSLRDSLAQITQDKEALAKRATSLQNEITELKSVAAAPTTEDVSSSEEDRQSLIQELSRGKAEAVKLLQQEMQRKLIDLDTKMSDKLRSSEETKMQLEEEVKTLKIQIVEQDQANKELELKLKFIQDKSSFSENYHINCEKDLELETVIKDLENKVRVAETKLAEKENIIAEMEVSSKLLAEEHNNKLMDLESKVDVASADRMQAESKLSERDHEIKELNNVHKQKLEEGQKVVTEAQSQLHLELSKKSEAEKKYKDLLNQLSNLDVALKNKDAELNSLSSEIVTLKERVQNLELKLNETTEECMKAGREKENFSSVLVGSLKAIAQLKHSLQALRTDASDRLTSAKEDISRMGFQVVDIFDLAKREVDAVRRELQDKDDVQANLRENLSVLEKELSEQRENIKYEGNLEGMLEDLRLSKKNLETELSENNAFVKKLQHELQNMTKTLEKKEQETSKLHANVADLQKELTNKMEKANEDLSNLKSDYKIKLASKDTEICELKTEHDQYCSKITSLQGDANITESKLEKISEDYKDLKQENEKLGNKVKELEYKCESLKIEFTAVTEERTRLGGTVEELTSVLTGHKIENDTLNEKIKKLEDSLSDSNDETTRAIETIKNLSDALMKTNKENQSLEIQIKEINEAELKYVENLKSQEAVWNNKSKLDEVKMKKLETSVQSLQNELKKEKQQFETETSNLSSQLEESQQRERELSIETEMVKKESIKAKEDQSNYESRISELKSELEEAQQREQLLCDQIENIIKESTNQGQLLKEKQVELEIMATEKETVLARSGTESAKTLETEAKLIALNVEREKWLEERMLLETKEKELEQLHMEAQQTQLLKEEYKSMNKNNNLLTKQCEQLNSVADSLRKTNIENDELIEQLKSDKTALENTINNKDANEKELGDKIKFLQSEVLNLKAENENLTSETEIKTQQLEELRKELHKSTSEISVAEETKLELKKVLIEKSHLEKQLENILEEQKASEQQLNDAENSRKDKQEKENLQIEKVCMENKEMQRHLDTALKEKLNLEQTLTTTLGNLEGLQMEMMAERDRCCLNIEELRKELEDTLLEKTDLERCLSAEVEKARGMQEVTALDLEKLRAEKGELEHQLDDTLLDLQAKEKKVSELEDIHVQKIKQLVHDFEKQLARKDEELINLEDKQFERTEQEANLQVREYRDRIRELHEASDVQGEAFQQLYLQHEEDIKVKDSELSDSEHRIQELQAAHERELSEVDKRWRQCLEQQLAEVEARHKEELTELSKEWHWERKTHVSNTETAHQKELENTSQLAVAAVESGTGSIELLHRQLVAQTNELKEAKRLHKLEVTELRRLLSLRRMPNSAERLPENTTLEDACTELEYLRNILYEYMMGKEPIVLARVLAAVVKFDTEQTARVLQKEEQKQTVLGQLGIL